MALVNAFDALATASQLPASPGVKPSTGAMPTVPSQLAGATWVGTAIDMTGYGSVTIWCTVAPSAPYAIEASDQNAGYIAQSAAYNNSGGVGLASSISAIGRCTLPGNCWLRLTGGTGGTFRIAGAN
jgi:hypothetical protein